MTVKNYGLSAVASLLELGKRGERLQSNGDGTLDILKSDGSLGTIKISGATSPDEPITLSQLDSRTLEDFGASASGKVLIEQPTVQDMKDYLGITSTTQATPYTVVTTNTTLVVGNKYYITATNVAVTLPNVSGVNVGDCIIVRSKSGISSTLEVDDDQTENILTDAGSATSVVLDVMAENTLVYAGSGVWEMI